MSNGRRLIWFCCVVVLSVVLPTILAVCSGYRFFFSAIEPFEFANLKNGEMWYTDYHSPGLFDVSQFAYVAHFKNRNLATGREQICHFDPAIQNEGCTPLWIGDESYVVSNRGVYQRTKSTSEQGAFSFKQIASLPNQTRTVELSESVFVYNGELTTVFEDHQSNCRLVHLRDGRWVDGRRIRLPSMHSLWFRSPNDGKYLFQPASHVASASLPGYAVPFATNTFLGINLSAAPSIALPATPVPPSPPESSGIPNSKTDELDGYDETDLSVTASPRYYAPQTFFTPAASWAISVQQLGDHVHVLFSTDGGFRAYRDGFVFEEETEEGISALAAENVLQDPGGWEPIPGIPGGEYIQRMVCDHEGALFSCMTGQLLRRSLSGLWWTISGFDDADSREHAILRMSTPKPRLIVDSSEGIVYVANDSGDVFRVTGETAQPTSFKVDDFLGQYMARWKWLLLGLTGAWLLHYLIVVTGTSFLVQKGSNSTYEFGNQNVKLASIWRRGLAYLIDVAILVTALSVSVGLHCRALGIGFASPNQPSQVNALMMLEKTLLYDGWQTLPMLVDGLIGFIALFFFDLKDGALVVVATVFATVLVDTGLALWSLKIFDEGRYGSTPGKWLLGIRTLRTTLRKSGFARALVRDVLSCVDLLGFLTPLPAAASMVFSSHRQRLGDRVADTIVIDANSQRRSTTTSS